MPELRVGMRQCEKCKKILKEETNFYTYKNGQKMEVCKTCLTMHVDNYDPETFCWILEKLDMPYVPSEWNVLRDRAYNADPSKMGPLSVIGKYISKMRLKKWCNLGWNDSERLQEQEREAEKAKLAEEERRQQELKLAFENGEISEAEYRTFTDTSILVKDGFQASAPKAHNVFTGEIIDGMPKTQYMSQEELKEAAGDLSSQLTQEDRVYLAMKWGRLYSEEEWIALEKNYTEMCNSFDIQDQDTKNTLILLCKTNLKMNQSMDSNDYEGALKFSRMYDTLRKSANFTAQQNKAKENEEVDCIGNLVVICERDGGKIPKLDVTIPRDQIDVALADMKNYSRELIEADPLILRQIEQYLKIKENFYKRKTDELDAKLGTSSLDLTHDDYSEFNEIYDNYRKQDEITGGEVDESAEST